MSPGLYSECALNMCEEIEGPGEQQGIESMSRHLVRGG